jgi:glycosyltransferase involved in cell wall biosynthesis
MHFLTLFPNCENVHLIKDVGMIPYNMHKNFKYNTSIACFKNGEYPYIENELNGVNIVFLKKYFNSEFINVTIFLIKNYRKIDILQCYHFTRQSLLYLNIFNFLKKISFSKKCTYLKLDASYDYIYLKLRPITFFLINKISIVSVENKFLYYFLNNNNTFKRKIIYVPNGINWDREITYVKYEEKSNLIITVGRIGTFVKFNETLLESFVYFSEKNPDWNLELIGPVEEEFKSYIKEYFKKNPQLKTKIIFTGNIDDRNALIDKYKKAKIFVLTSRSEGFPLVLLEALKNGCNIICSDILPAMDITNNQKHGLVFNIGDIQSLLKCLNILNKNEDLMKRNSIISQQYAYENFRWNKICSEINSNIYPFFSKTI